MIAKPLYERIQTIDKPIGADGHSLTLPSPYYERNKLLTKKIT